jgi:hypothetical protein
MRPSLLRLLVVGAIGLGAGIAVAGTPLPNPPFTTGGFVPPDSLAFKQEVAVGKLLSKYALGLAKCDQQALIGLQLAYEPANPSKIGDLQQAWTDCRAGVRSKYDIGRGKLTLKGTPACLDQAGIDAIKAQIDAQFPLLAPFVYCDGDAAAPDPVTGLNIPDFKNEANGEVAAAKVLIKAGTLAGKCYALALKAAFKSVSLGGDGSLDPGTQAKITTCFDRATVASNAAMDKLDQTHKLPDCLPVASAKNLVTSTIGVAGQFNDETYCASPSGAFVAGDDTR